MFKRFTLIVLVAFAATTVRGNNDKLLSSLSYVNAEWQHQPERYNALKDVDVSANKTFTDWIATHLMLVEQTLRQRDVSEFSASQQRERTQLLDVLHGYWQAKVFPVNDYLRYKNPVFIDRVGTHCAVGYLMQQSGAEALARAIDAREKFAYVHEIQTPGVADWASTHGFTVDELAWIQPGYPPTYPTYDLDGGLNGTVNVVTADASGMTVYVGGTFTQSVSGINASNIAVWQNGFAGFDWMDIGGTNGEVNALLLDGTNLYVGGNFTVAGGTAVMNIAVYDIVNSTWQSLGVLPGTVRAIGKYNGEIFAGGDFTDLLLRWNGTQWTTLPGTLIYGNNVRAINVWNNMLVFGGDFEWATGALRKNAGAFDGNYMMPLGFGTPTPVNDLAGWEGKLYAACDAVHGNDSCALASFTQDDWVVELRETSDFSSQFFGKSLLHLQTDNVFLYASGDFMLGMGLTWGNGMMRIERYFQNQQDTVGMLFFSPLLTTDSAVNSFVIRSNNIIFGGAFTGNSFGYDTLNHIGQMETIPMSIEEPLAASTVLCFPNPAASSISIRMGQGDEMQQLQVLDATGRTLLQQRISGTTAELPVAQLPAGIYHLVVGTANGSGSTRFVKQ